MRLFSLSNPPVSAGILQDPSETSLLFWTKFPKNNDTHWTLVALTPTYCWTLFSKSFEISSKARDVSRYIASGIELKSKVQLSHDRSAFNNFQLFEWHIFNLSCFFIMYIHYLWAPSLAVLAMAQSFPPKPTALRILESKLVPGASISFKKVSLFNFHLITLFTNARWACYAFDSNGSHVRQLFAKQHQELMLSVAMSISLAKYLVMLNLQYLII